MKTVKIRTKDNWTSAEGRTWSGAHITIADGNVTEDGITYPIKAVRSYRIGINNYDTSVAYDDTQPQQGVKQTVPATETVQPTVDTSAEVKPVSKPRFRLHKPTKAVEPVATQTEAEKSVSEPAEPVAEPDAVAGTDAVEQEQVDPAVVKALAELIVSASKDAPKADDGKNADSSVVINASETAGEPDNTYELRTVDGGVIRIEYWMARE